MSTKTGTHPFWTIGLTVVGKPEATVMTSSPFVKRRFPRSGEVSVENATRFAEEPELTRRQWRRPKRLAKRFSNSFA
jgi:Cys-tRNA synthase (O-phospho-L-seryl-tRNA:Cys-tRNA synthase)